MRLKKFCGDSHLKETFSEGKKMITLVAEDFIYEKEYALKEKTSDKRLIVTPDKEHVKMMLGLLSGGNKNHRYSMAYFLLNGGKDALGKYQTAKALAWDELEIFCEKYSDYLETDARHNFGIRDIETKDTVIYDNHNVLYVFGNLEEKIKILENNGYKRVEKIVIPRPHTHFYYNDVNGDIEDDLLKSNEWIFTPVKIRDDDDEDDDWDKDIPKKSLFDLMFDYLETETL